MRLLDLISRGPPEPWKSGGKIPWGDPAFSARMLDEHLSQDHDWASRKQEKINRHVEWIRREFLPREGGRVLDLGCGPGFYTARMARIGHVCVGIDCSPASIDHARSEADGQGLACEYRLQDMREGRFGKDFDLALLIYGELDTFRREEAGAILAEARNALGAGGFLVLEVHEEAFVRELGERAPTWHTASQGLFSARPYLCLQESFWSEEERVAIERYSVIELETADVITYHSTTAAYSENEYATLLKNAGFCRAERYPSLVGGPSEGDDGLFVLVARPSHAATRG